MIRRSLRTVVAGAVATSLLVAVPAGRDAATARAGSLTITSVSNPRPALVSGGQVLVRVAGADGGDVTVTRNGADVTSAFVAQENGTLLGLVTGLDVGANTLQASAAGGAVADLDVTNYPITGPVFSGARQAPFHCQTTAFGLAAADPPACSATPKISYFYKKVNRQGEPYPALTPLDDPRDPPTTPATTTVNGRTVDFIVRREQGVIDRAVYEISALWDGGAPDPVRADSSWNGNVVYTFGGSCRAGYHQGGQTGGVIDRKSQLFLGKGYAVASSSLNVLGVNCGTVLSAEVAMMVKEHLAETYGPIRSTIGWGGSGGGLQQLAIADAYPGLLDGVIPGIPFPNANATTLDVATDCRLLDYYFYPDGTPRDGFDDAARLAVTGFGDYSSCPSWDDAFAGLVSATELCPHIVPMEQWWDPQTNPDGITCNAAAPNVNQVGVNPATGFANSFIDNVGVQYGLTALLDDALSAQQFVELNAGIGGFDFAGHHVAARTRADVAGVRASYADDLMVTGGLGLRTTPVIDQRVYLDPYPGDNIHTAHWSYVIRDRLRQAGIAGNEVLIESGKDTSDTDEYVLDAMQAWLNAIAADRAPGRTPQQKVLRDKPAGLTDGCFLPGATAPTAEALAYRKNTGPCSQAYPIHADPRLVAGAPLAELTAKCRLKPLARSDYPGVTFTDAQWTSLRRTFPRGVCDWTRPGVGQVRPRGTWLTYPSP